MHNSPFSFLPSTPHIYLSFLLFKVMAFTFYFLIHTHTRSYSLYVYVLRPDHLVLDNQLVCPSLRKTFSPSQNSLVACSYLYRAEASSPSLDHWNTFIVFVFSSGSGPGFFSFHCLQNRFVDLTVMDRKRYLAYIMNPENVP